MNKPNTKGIDSQSLTSRSSGRLRFNVMPNREVVKMKEWTTVVPAESNGNCLFATKFEKYPLVLFHATPYRNKDSIISDGFKSASSLGVGELQSVSYAKNSSHRLAHIGFNAMKIMSYSP